MASVEYITVVVSFVNGTVGIFRPNTRVFSTAIANEREGIISESRAVLDYLASDEDAVTVLDGKIVPREDVIAERTFAIMRAYRDLGDKVIVYDDAAIEKALDKMALANPTYAKENRAGWRVVADGDLPTVDRPLWRDTGDAVVVDPSLYPVVVAMLEKEYASDLIEVAKKVLLDNLSDETKAKLTGG